MYPHMDFGALIDWKHSLVFHLVICLSFWKDKCVWNKIIGLFIKVFVKNNSIHGLGIFLLDFSHKACKFGVLVLLSLDLFFNLTPLNLVKLWQMVNRHWLDVALVSDQRIGVQSSLKSTHQSLCKFDWIFYV